MHWARLAKDQPAEITIVQISEVQESPAFNGRRSFLTLRDRHFRSLLAQFGLTPKSKRGLAAGEVV